jgi:hypothetical protein
MKHRISRRGGGAGVGRVDILRMVGDLGRGAQRILRLVGDSIPEYDVDRGRAVRICLGRVGAS